MKKLSFFCLLPALSFILNSCIKKPVFINIDSVKIGPLRDSIIETTINFKVYNPNGIKSVLTASKIKTYYKEKLVGSSTINNGIALPAKDTVIIPLISSINLRSLSEVFPELLATDSASFKIEGKNSVKAIGFTWNIPLKDKIKLNVKKAIVEQVGKTFQSDSNFRIKNLELSNLRGLNKTGFHMVVQVKNSFPFNYRLLQFNLNIYRKHGTNPIANWKLTDTIEQKVGALANLPIVVEVDNLNLLSEARLSDILHPNMEILLKGKAEISIQGRTFIIPVEVARKVAFNPLTGFNL